MAKRVKSEKQIVKAIADWQKADEFVKQIGELQIKIDAANYQQAAMLNQIKESTAEAVAPMQEEIKLLAESLEVFAAAHKNDFGSDRSRKLNFGTLGWRKSSSIIIKKAAETLEKIKWFFDDKAAQYIRTKEEPDKEALARLRDEDLAGVGARRKVTDDFFVEPSLPEAKAY